MSSFSHLTFIRNVPLKTTVSRLQLKDQPDCLNTKHHKTVSKLCSCWLYFSKMIMYPANIFQFTDLFFLLFQCYWEAIDQHNLKHRDDRIMLCWYFISIARELSQTLYVILLYSKCLPDKQMFYLYFYLGLLIYETTRKVAFGLYLHLSAF